MNALDKGDYEEPEGTRIDGGLPCCHCDSSDAVSVYLKEPENEESYKDGFCFSCGEYIKPSEVKLVYKDQQSDQPKEVKVSKDDMKELDRIAELGSNGSKLRKLEEKYMEMYGIKVDKDEEGRVTHHYYPVTKAEGLNSKITGYKIRVLPKKWSAVGDTQNGEMFGQHVFKDGKMQVSKKFIVVTEGEIDCVAVQQTMSKFGNANYTNAVVSLPNGAASAVKAIQRNWKWLNTFENIIIMFDMDEAGQEAALKVAKKLPLGKCKIAKFSEKDAGDMVKKGKGKELYEAFWKAETYSPEGVLAGNSLWDIVSTPLQESDAHYPWAGLDKMLHGIRTGEMVTLTAGCVDADTEYLTPTGWKRIADYEEGDLVGEYSESGEILFKEPELYHKYEAETLSHFSTKYGVDQCLSDEHNVVYLSDKMNIQRKKFSEVKKVHEDTVRGFSGRFITTFNAPQGLKGIDLTDDEIRLMVAVMADGSYRSNSNHAGVRIKKERKKARLVKLLESAGIDYSRKEVAPYEGFEKFCFYTPIKTKNFDSFWWNCNAHQLKVICEEVLHWDGNQRNQFYSSDTCDIDFLQYAFATIGLRSTVLVDDRDSRMTDRPCYRLQITKQNTCGIKGDKDNKVEITPYKTPDGYKYCFTTSTGMWVMRRNNRIAVTGNSGVAKSTFARMVAYHLQKSTDDSIGMIFLEESVKKTSLQMMSLEAKKLLHLPETETTEDEMRKAYDNTLGMGQYYFFDDFASQDFDAISDAILYMAKACGCKYIFLDHISMLVSGGEYGDERRALDAICTKLRTMTQQLDITLFAITHLKRPQGTPHEEGGQTSLSQLRGSAGVGQLSDIVIGFERNSQAEDAVEKNTTHVRILKNRFSGECGYACSLLYDKDTGHARELGEHEVAEMDTDSSEFDDIPEFEDAIEQDKDEVF